MRSEELKINVSDDLRGEPAVRRPRTYLRAHDGTVTVSGPLSNFSRKPGIDQTALRVTGIEATDVEDPRQAATLKRVSTLLRT